MKNSTPDSIEGIARKRSAVRPNYIVLGEDTDDLSYIYRTFDETIHIVQQFDLRGRSVDGYVKFVRDEVDDRDWAEWHYYTDDENPFKALASTIKTGVSA
ncbi:hypothetical protein [Natrinema hispanicum]|nr:hypothetical protein [Natrinema hispanicum]